MKSRIQADGFAGADRQYASTLDCVRKVWRREGLNGFTRGLGPTLVRYVDQALPIITQKHYLLTEQLSPTEDRHSRMVQHSLDSNSLVEHLVLRIRYKLDAGVLSTSSLIFWVFNKHTRCTYMSRTARNMYI